MSRQALARLAAILLLAACMPSTSQSPVESIGPTTAPPASSIPAPSPGSSQPAAARSADGIPEAIDGRPVLRGRAAREFAAGQADATAFLIGGWVTWVPGPGSCPLVPIDEAGSWTRDCRPPQFTDVAGTLDERLSAAVTFRFVLEELRTGPVIAEVHVHDPRAAECGSARDACDAMMVVERLLWVGDDATAPGPLTAEVIAEVILEAQGSRDMRAWGDGGFFTDCGASFASAELFTVDSGNTLTPGVTLVELEPSIEAMFRAAPADPVECETHAVANGIATDTDHRWLIVANAALLVRTNGEPSLEDRAFIDELRRVLGQLAAGE